MVYISGSTPSLFSLKCEGSDVKSKVSYVSYSYYVDEIHHLSSVRHLARCSSCCTTLGWISYCVITIIVQHPPKGSPADDTQALQGSSCPHHGHNRLTATFTQSIDD
jgi:hypothetical protein